MAAAAGILFASAAGAQPGGAQGPPPVSVVVDAARMETVEQIREVTGELRAVRRSLVAAEEAGRVVEMAAEPGDLVRAGDTLATLDSTILRLEAARTEIEVRRREALLREREANLEKAERDLRRVVELAERSSATQNEIDNANTAVSEARARRDQAEAEIEWAKIEHERLEQRLRDMTIVAPFAGRVESKQTEVGAWVGDGDPVVELVALDEIDVWISVPQQLIASATAPRRELSVLLEATGEMIVAPVSGISPTADSLSRMFPVRLRLANPEHKMKPGMSVVGFVPTGARAPALTVHKDAVLRDEAGAYVYYSADGMAAVARVETRFATGERVVVRAPGLAEGALVVIEGNERLTPGRRLMVVGGGAPAGGDGAAGQAADAGKETR